MSMDISLKLNELKLPLELKDVVGNSVIYDLDCPGVFYLDIRRDGEYMGRYLVSKDTLYITDTAKSYGKPIKDVPGYLIYEYGMRTGWHLIEYEERGYMVKNGSAKSKELQRIRLKNTWAYPEYFGKYPVPLKSPAGDTVSYRTVGNGVYILKSTTGQEMLSVSYPAKDYLSDEVREKAVTVGQEGVMDDIFFTMEVSCLPIFELLDYLQKWIYSELIDRAVLFNTIYGKFPWYAIENNLDEQKQKAEYYKTLVANPNLCLLDWKSQMITLSEEIDESAGFFRFGDKAEEKI